MPTYRGGRHEHGQNFLNDSSTIDRIVDAVDATAGPIIEIGPGHGALTKPLAYLGRSLTAVEIDSHAVGLLRRSLGADVEVIHDDFLRWHLPASPHVIVGNVPFHLTTAILRHLLHAPGWTDAVLTVQWEVARRRAGVGGATMMTAQWWPWFDFSVRGRVPRDAFTPQPAVDGGILVLNRRDEPLLDADHRTAYRRFVHAVFTGRGRGIAGIVSQVARPADKGRVQRALTRAGVRPDTLPRDLDASQWVTMYRELCPSSPRPHHGRPRPGRPHTGRHGGRTGPHGREGRHGRDRRPGSRRRRGR